MRVAILSGNTWERGERFFLARSSPGIRSREKIPDTQPLSFWESGLSQRRKGAEELSWRRVAEEFKKTQTLDHKGIPKKNPRHSKKNPRHSTIVVLGIRALAKTQRRRGVLLVKGGGGDLPVG
jgi:hypothetical protein